MSIRATDRYMGSQLAGTWRVIRGHGIISKMLLAMPVTLAPPMTVSHAGEKSTMLLAATGVRAVLLPCMAIGTWCDGMLRGGRGRAEGWGGRAGVEMRVSLCVP